jgi:N6-L-threonylcarbamoyladenine synthase
MKILAIETSCDETAVCIIEASGDLPAGEAGINNDFRFEVLGNALYSQVAIHAPYGGVFPNLAKREHAKNLIPLLTQALEQSSKGRSYVKSVDNRIGRPAANVKIHLSSSPPFIL